MYETPQTHSRCSKQPGSMLGSAAPSPGLSSVGLRPPILAPQPSWGDMAQESGPHHPEVRLYLGVST